MFVTAVGDGDSVCTKPVDVVEISPTLIVLI